MAEIIIRREIHQPSAAHRNGKRLARKAFTVERDGSAQPFLPVGAPQNGRAAIGIGLSHYLRHWWLDDGEAARKSLSCSSRLRRDLSGGPAPATRPRCAGRGKTEAHIQEQNSNEVSAHSAGPQCRHAQGGRQGAVRLADYHYALAATGAGKRRNLLWKSTS